MIVDTVKIVGTFAERAQDLNSKNEVVDEYTAAENECSSGGARVAILPSGLRFWLVDEVDVKITGRGSRLVGYRDSVPF
jgi:hypothetical protein